ncbi:MAG: hypothetical protein HQL26_09925 [Candidatus Omnitrophica bacterium]|nr:hypothetical protein [Candidatus Omnitrophota bacterium]
MAYLARLWVKIYNKSENFDERKKALADLEWWFFQANPAGRAGASMGDALSMIAQINLGIKIRETYVHQDLVALSSTLEDYRETRAKEFKTNDSPQLAEPALKGGIDLNPVDNALKIKNNGGEIKFNIDPAMLEQLKSAPGFVPMIISIQPMTDLRTFLGINAVSH